ncbi:DUF6270 domain-containing protein [Sanguibacter sp. Leaf3]|uniref:DUF6270 domain-containing protein n=1 Tax=Sanguibacter sp. Leaf3 TaxID=1736209 RepID=UPI0006F5EA83|nr:YqiA/YcfP family alpha/beta fold hydrolase [Sanguibacter sp. Leaf3]KQT99843.1 hypothetical protein ASG53_03155 [Sanguibacter sp. Leaf3]
MLDAERIRVAIYGSCVSRDTFEYLAPNFELVSYTARQSLVSAFTAPVDPAIDLALSMLPSEFQRRMLLADARSSLVDSLDRLPEDLDLLVWDLVDERLGISRFEDGSVQTRSVEQIRAGIVPDNAEHVRFGSATHRRLWSDALHQWGEALDARDLIGRTVLLAPPWAVDDSEGDPTPASFGLRPDEANEITERYVEQVRTTLGVPVITTRDVVAAVDHRWGRAAFHYSDDVYQRLAVELSTHAFSCRRERILAIPPPLSRDSLPLRQHSASVGSLTISEHPGRYVVAPVDGGALAVDLAVVPRDSDVLTVYLHGGVEPGPDRLPRFEWLRSLAGRPESKLYISDPTLSIDEQLKNAWYVGTEGEDLTPRLAQIVDAVQAQVGARHVVLIGSSAGGFAAARIASARSEPSVALAFSTQRSLAHGPRAHVEGFLSTVFPGENYEAVHARLGDRVSLEETLAQATAARFVWVQNTGDVEHMRDHFAPYALAQGLAPETGGTSHGRRVHLTPMYYGPGHPVPPLDLMHASIDAAVSYARQGDFPGIDWLEHAPPPDRDATVSSSVDPPRLVSPEPSTTHPAGSVHLHGTATPGDTVTLEIGGHRYQTVTVTPDGTWEIYQSFAPAPRWSVHLFAARGGTAISESVMVTLEIVRTSG